MKYARYMFILVALAALLPALIILAKKASLAGNVLTGNVRVTSPISSPTPRATPSEDEATTPTVARITPTPAPTSVLLQATLPHLGGEPPLDPTGVVGVAAIDPEDIEEFYLQLEQDDPGSGPQSIEDLANVREWLPAPIRSLEDAATRFGPVELPVADGYELAAWTADHVAYFGTFRLDGPPMKDRIYDAGPLAPLPPTSLSVRLVNVPASRPTFLAHLIRMPGEGVSLEAIRLGRIYDLMAPDIAFAYQGEAPLFLDAGGENLISPLMPEEALRLRLITTDGLEAEPIDVSLTPAGHTSVEIDVSEIFPDLEGGTFALRGRVLLGETEEPIAGAEILRLGAIEQRATTDEGGRFEMAHLPWGPALNFEISTPWEEEQGRPALAERHTRSFAPTPEMSAAPLPLGEPRLAEVTWRLPAFRWLVVQTTEEAEQILEEAEIPYPIYLLQRLDEVSGAWHDAAADEFRPEMSGMAVSVVEPGRYRVLAALSALAVFPSAEAQFDLETSERAVSLTVPPRFTIRPTILRLADDETGEALSRRYVTVGGPHGSLPPFEGSTDRLGEVSLGPTTVDRIVVYVEDEEGEGREVEIDLTGRHGQTIEQRI